jgi:2-alkyl-3-oxoalkanoate reductase
VSRPTLVTGASGGLGIALVDALSAAGRDVVAVGRRTPSDPRLQRPGIDYRQINLTDHADVERLVPEGVGTVFHCAALSAPWGRRADFRSANVEVTRNLLAVAAARAADAFIHVSSPSIYAAMHDRPGITEEDAPADPPLNDYARTKLDAERLVLRNHGSMSTVVVRPRAIVGPDDAVVLPRLTALVRSGRIPLLRGGRALVEFTDVRDVVSALLAAERHAGDARGQAINISGGQPVTVRNAAMRLADALGVEARTVDLPLPAARAVAALVEALWPRGAGTREPRLTRYALATLAYTQTFDLSRARALLGWSSRHDGLATLLGAAQATR